MIIRPMVRSAIEIGAPLDVFARACLERSAPINMPNRQADMSAAYADPHGVVFSPKSTDPSNLGINMCINILEGDNSPRVKEDGIKDVTQHMQNMKIYVSVTRTDRR